MRHPFRWIVLLAALLALGASAAGAEPVRIGVLFPLTGPWAPFGEEAFVSADIARELVNERGGVWGQEVVYVTADVPNPTAATSEADRLISREGLKVLMGTYASPLALAGSAVAERNRVIYWEVIGAADQITERGFRYLFAVAQNTSSYGAAAAEYAATVIAPALGKAPSQLRTAILWEDRPFGTAIGAGVRRRARELGLNIIFDQSYDQFTPDLSPVVLRLRDLRPDVIIATSYYQDAVLFQRQARELGLYVPAFVGTSAGYGLVELADALGSAVNGIFNSDIPSRINPQGLRPEARELHDVYLQRFRSRMGKEPTGFGTASFSGAWLLLTQVLPKAGSMDPERIRQAALSLDLPEGSLITGWGVKFAPPGAPNAGYNVRSFSIVQQWQQGRLVTVWPEHLATHRPIHIPLPPWEQR